MGFHFEKRKPIWVLLLFFVFKGNPYGFSLTKKKTHVGFRWVCRKEYTTKQICTHIHEQREKQNNQRMVFIPQKENNVVTKKKLDRILGNMEKVVSCKFRVSFALGGKVIV